MVARPRRWRTLLSRLFTRWARVVGGEASPPTVEPEAGKRGATATPGGPPAHWLEAVRQARPDLFAEREHVFPVAQADPSRPGAPPSTPLTPTLSPLRGARGSERWLRGATGHEAAKGQPIAEVGGTGAYPSGVEPEGARARDQTRELGDESLALSDVSPPSPFRPPRLPLRGARGPQGSTPSSPREAGLERASHSPRRGASESERLPSVARGPESRADHEPGRSAPSEPSPPPGSSWSRDPGPAALPGTSRPVAPRPVASEPPPAGEASLRFDSWGLRAAGTAGTPEAGPGARAAKQRAPESSSPGTAAGSVVHEFQWPAGEQGWRRERGLDELRDRRLLAAPLTPTLSPRSAARGPELTRSEERVPELAQSGAAVAECPPAAPEPWPAPAWSLAPPDPWPPLPAEAVAEAVNLRLEARRSAHRRRLEREQRGQPWSA